MALPAGTAIYKEPEAWELVPENFPPLENDRLLRAAKFLPVDRVPVWVMRQAGRYLPEYHEAGGDKDFFYKCQTPALACQLTLQPLCRFPLDASIIFSDILVVLQALGMECRMEKARGPVFPEPLVDPSHIDRLNAKVDVGVTLDYVFKAITLTRHRIQGKVPLLGFCGSPWTLLAYAVEGKSSKTWGAAKTWLYKYPQEAHRALSIITDVSIEYLVRQVQAGAQGLQVFDSWAGILSPRLFKEFSLPYLAKIATAVKARLGVKAVPMICFAKGAHFAFKWLESTDYDVVSLDWTMDGAEVRRQFGNGRMAVQGNIDPCVLYADEKTIRHEVALMMSEFGTLGHIANLGHGIDPDVDPESVRVFVDAVHHFSSEQRVVRIGTRSSVLALVQAEQVLNKLTAAFPAQRFEIVTMSSLADKDLAKDLSKFSVVGVFTDALEQALLRGEIDLIVHSLKDLPSRISEHTALAAISEREDPRDAVVFNAKYSHLKHISELPEGTTVGTSSARRKAMLSRAYPHLRFKFVRGNVKTRLRKLDDLEGQGYAALILAAAGLKRLHMAERIGHYIDTAVCAYAIGQGALGIQVRKAGADAAFDAEFDKKVFQLCHDAVNHAPTATACLAERAFLRQLGGGCSLPIGVVSTLAADGTLTLNGRVLSLEGARCIEHTMSKAVATTEDAEALGVQLCEHLIANGAKDLLTEIRAAADAEKAKSLASDSA